MSSIKKISLKITPDPYDNGCIQMTRMYVFCGNSMKEIFDMMIKIHSDEMLYGALDILNIDLFWRDIKKKLVKIGDSVSVSGYHNYTYTMI